MSFPSQLLTQIYNLFHACKLGKDCSRFQFECANEGQPLIYPQCIAIYDKCDGIIHCKDNSDELNCDASAPKGNFLLAIVKGDCLDVLNLKQF